MPAGDQAGDRIVGAVLHPLTQGRGAPQLIGRVGVQRGLGLPDRAAGDDLVGRLGHSGLHLGHIVQPPGVGLVDVDAGAQETPGRQQVAFASHRVDLAGLGQQFGRDAVGHRPERGLGHRQAGRQAGCQARRTRAGRVPQDVEVAAGASPATALLGQPLRLPAGQRQSGADGGLLGPEPAVDRCGHGLQAAGDHRPVIVTGLRHQVVDLADRVQVAGDTVHRQQVGPCLVGLQFQPEPLVQGRQGAAIHLVERGQCPRLGQRPAGQVSESSPAVGGEVVVAVLANVLTQVGREHRTEFHRGGEVALGQGVHGGRDAGLGHGATLTIRPGLADRPGRTCVRASWKDEPGHPSQWRKSRCRR